MNHLCDFLSCTATAVYPSEYCQEHLDYLVRVTCDCYGRYLLDSISTKGEVQREDYRCDIVCDSCAKDFPVLDEPNKESYARIKLLTVDEFKALPEGAELLTVVGDVWLKEDVEPKHILNTKGGYLPFGINR